ncbi:MAG: hypothetical protein ACYC9Z_04345 [Casimicrobiaceae bacterium]
MNSSTSSSDPDRAARRFLVAAAATVLSILAATTLINVVVDPYRVFDLVDAAGFNARKPRAMEHGYLSKVAAVASIRPERVIVGNSRAQVGLDPESAQWHDSLITYNAALPGTGPGTALEFMRAARAAGRLREAVIGLDFLDFLVDDRGPGVAAAAALPMVADPRPPKPDVPSLDPKALIGVTVSFDALLDSVYTVATQDTDATPDLTRLGFLPMRDYQAMATQDGYGAFFLQRDQENAAAYLHDPKALFDAGSHTSPEWRQLGEMKALCEGLERGCTFLIYPYHVHILEMFAMTGLWTPFEAWKRELVRRLDPGSITDRGSRIVLWDFSGYDRYACERVPAMGDRSTTMHWYWESGHFKRELGDLVIARIRGGADKQFGTRLDGSTIDAALARIREDRDRYREENPSDVAALAKLVAGMRAPGS